MGAVGLVFFLVGRGFWCFSAVTRLASWEIGHGTSGEHAWEWKREERGASVFPQGHKSHHWEPTERLDKKP